MITHDPRWSLPRGNTLVPSRWQATSRSSRRHPPIQRSAIAFMRGVRMLQRTVRIPASARIASKVAVKFDPRSRS
jgi:hypothetical protein